jgi:hypothetical protein
MAAMRASRLWAVAAMACLAVTVAACGSSSPGATGRTLPTPGLGANSTQVENFFEQQGGGHFQVGAITGGLIGYAIYKGVNEGCPVTLGGTADNVNEVHLFCSSGGAITSTPEQTRSIIKATVHRFAPGVTDWATQIVNKDLAAGTATEDDKKVTGKISVEISRTPMGEINLDIRPQQLTLHAPSSVTSTTARQTARTP